MSRGGLMVRARRLALLALVAVTTCGCLCSEEKAKPNKETVQPAASAKRADKKGALSRPDLQDIEIPTSEQFEQEAEKSISLDNMESELNRLEKEIGE
jgi:hypothetical protein